MFVFFYIQLLTTIRSRERGAMETKRGRNSIDEPTFHLKSCIAAPSESGFCRGRFKDGQSKTPLREERPHPKYYATCGLAQSLNSSTLPVFNCSILKESGSRELTITTMFTNERTAYFMETMS